MSSSELAGGNRALRKKYCTCAGELKEALVRDEEGVTKATSSALIKNPRVPFRIPVETGFQYRRSLGPPSH